MELPKQRTIIINMVTANGQKVSGPIEAWIGALVESMPMDKRTKTFARVEAISRQIHTVRAMSQLNVNGG